MPLDILLHSFPVDTGDVYVVTVFSEETTEGGHVMAVPRICVFGENIAHSTFIGVTACLAKRKTVRDSDKEKKRIRSTSLICNVTEKQMDGATEKSTSYGSLKSPAWSCVSITLPPAS